MFYLCGVIRLFFLLCVLAPGWARTQDAAFSQTFSSPQVLNPALTGLISGRYRVAINHRSQWAGVMPSAFQTSAFAADFHYDFDPRRGGGDGFGAGVYFLNDRVADVSYSNTVAMLGLAYHKRLDDRGEQTLSAGIQGGITQRSLGYGELTFQDEFNGTTGFNGGTTGELLPENSFARGDIQLGVNFSYDPRRRNRLGLFAGASVHHLTAPEHSFYAGIDRPDQQVEVTNKLYRRYTAYANVRIPLNRTGTWASPRLVVLRQGPHTTLTGGIDLRFPLDPAEVTALHLGGWARGVQGRTGYNATTLVGVLGLETNGFLIGLSYDANLGWQGVSQRHRGAIELTFSYTGRSEDDEAVPCPKF